MPSRSANGSSIEWPTCSTSINPVTGAPAGAGVSEPPPPVSSNVKKFRPVRRLILGDAGG